MKAIRYENRAELFVLDGNARPIRYEKHNVVKPNRSNGNMVLVWSENPSCIDLILTNKPKSFQGTYVIETGLSDFHRMTLAVLKTHYRKLPPRIINYRDFSNFDNAAFMYCLTEALSQQNDLEVLSTDSDRFYKICSDVLQDHAPRKKKYVRGNNKPFMNKTLSKAIMKRTRLRNKFLKDPSEHNKHCY